MTSNDTEQRRSQLGRLPIFVHIIKTGGTSVREAFFANMGEQPFLDVLLQVNAIDSTGHATTLASPECDIQEFVSVLMRYQFEVAYVVVNLPFGAHTYLTRQVRYFSMLRDPVDRCISYWYFTLNHHPRIWQEFAEYDFDIERLTRTRGFLTFSNQQTRMITGTQALVLTDNHFEEAKQLIEDRYEFVGAFDCFEASLETLSRLLKWRRYLCPRLNVGDRSRTDALPSRVRDAFFDLNDIDRRLYRWLLTSHLPRLLVS